MSRVNLVQYVISYHGQTEPNDIHLLLPSTEQFRAATTYMHLNCNGHISIPSFQVGLYVPAMCLPITGPSSHCDSDFCSGQLSSTSPYSPHPEMLTTVQSKICISSQEDHIWAIGVLSLSTRGCDNSSVCGPGKCNLCFSTAVSMLTERRISGFPMPFMDYIHRRRQIPCADNTDR